MAIGRTFPESLQKALRSLEQGRAGLTPTRPRRARRPRRRGAAGPRPRWRRPSASSSSKRPCAGASRRRPSPSAPGSTRGSSTSSAAIIGRPGRELENGAARARSSRGRLAAAQAARVLRRPAGLPARSRARPMSRAARLAAGVAPTFKTVDTCAAEFAADDAVPLLHLRGRGGGPAPRSGPGHHPRLGAQPHRPGDRVRLLLRARVDGPARGRLRDGHGQLQPRDGLDRLRHLRPALLRAAHRTRTSPKSSPPRAGQRAARGAWRA